VSGKWTIGPAPSINTIDAGPGLAAIDNGGYVSMEVDPVLLQRIDAIESRGPSDENLTDFFAALDRYIDAAVDRKLVERNVVTAEGPGAHLANIQDPDVLKQEFVRARGDLIGCLHVLIEAARGSASTDTP